MVDRHLDGTAFRDLRPHAQQQADVLPVDGLERIAAAGGAVGGERAGDDRHVLTHLDGRQLVVERDHVRRRQDVGVAVGFERARHRAQAEFATHLAEQAEGQAGRQARQSAGAVGGARALGCGQRQVDDAVVRTAAGEVLQAAETVFAVGVAGGADPLHAEFGRLVGGHFDHQRLDVDLGPAHVELVDHRAQVAVHGIRRSDDQAVGRDVGLDEARTLAAALGALLALLGEGVAGAADAGAALQALLAAEAALPALARLAAGAGRDRAALRALLLLRHRRRILRDHGAQGLGHARGFRVLEVDHVDIALARALLIQAGDQALGQVGARLRRRADHDRVGARVGQHRDPARIAAGGRFHQARDELGDIAGDRVANRNHIEVGRHRRVERGDDARQAAQVVGVVGDDQRVVARVRHDGVIGRNQRTQHGGEVGGRLIGQIKHLGRDLVAGGLAGTHAADLGRRGLQLGLGLGHHLGIAVAAGDHREALQAQGRGEQAEGFGLAQRFLGHQGERALDPRVDDEGHAGVVTDGLDHRLDVGIDEAQGGGVRAVLRQRGQRQRDHGGGAAQHGAGGKTAQGRQLQGRQVEIRGGGAVCFLHYLNSSAITFLPFTIRRWPSRFNMVPSWSS